MVKWQNSPQIHNFEIHICIYIISYNINHFHTKKTINPVALFWFWLAAWSNSAIVHLHLLWWPNEKTCKICNSRDKNLCRVSTRLRTFWTLIVIFITIGPPLEWHICDKFFSSVIHAMTYMGNICPYHLTYMCECYHVILLYVCFQTRCVHDIVIVYWFHLPQGNKWNLAIESIHMLLMDHPAWAPFINIIN